MHELTIDLLENMVADACMRGCFNAIKYLISQITI